MTAQLEYELPYTLSDLTGTNLGPFSTEFTCEAVTDVEVYYWTAEDDPQLLTRDVDYTLSGSSPELNGYDVTLSAVIGGASWPSGARLLRVRATEERQDSEFADNLGARPSVIGRLLNRLMRISQEHARDLERAVKAPFGVSGEAYKAQFDEDVAAVAGSAASVSEDRGAVEAAVGEFNTKYEDEVLPTIEQALADLTGRCLVSDFPTLQAWRQACLDRNVAGTWHPVERDLTDDLDIDFPTLGSWQGVYISSSAGSILHFKDIYPHDEEQQIFDATLNVRGMGGFARPQWFGWTKDGTAANNGAAMARCIAAQDVDGSFDSPRDGSILRIAADPNVATQPFTITATQNFSPSIEGAGHAPAGTGLNFSGDGGTFTGGLTVAPNAANTVATYRVANMTLRNAGGCPYPLVIGGAGPNYFSGNGISTVEDIIVEPTGSQPASMMVRNVLRLHMNRLFLRNTSATGAFSFVFRSDIAAGSGGDCKLTDSIIESPEGNHYNSGCIKLLALNGAGLPEFRMESVILYHGKIIDGYIDNTPGSSIAQLNLSNLHFEGDDTVNNGAYGIKITLAGANSLLNDTVNDRPLYNALQGPAVVSVVNPLGGTFTGWRERGARFQYCWGKLYEFENGSGVVLDIDSIIDCGYPEGTVQAAIVLRNMHNVDITVRMNKDIDLTGYDYLVHLDEDCRAPNIRIICNDGDTELRPGVGYVLDESPPHAGKVIFTPDRVSFMGIEIDSDGIMTLPNADGVEGGRLRLKGAPGGADGTFSQLGGWTRLLDADGFDIEKGLKIRGLTDLAGAPAYGVYLHAEGGGVFSLRWKAPPP